MTSTSLTVRPPAVAWLPSVRWRVSVDGRYVVPGAATPVSAGPVLVTLHVEARAPGVRVAGTLQITVEVPDGGPTTVVVGSPFPSLAGRRAQALAGISSPADLMTTSAVTPRRGW